MYIPLEIVFPLLGYYFYIHTNYNFRRLETLLISNNRGSCSGIFLVIEKNELQISAGTGETSLKIAFE
jgi:hypothetical protein